MRCNKHARDYSSSVGVCASCLRERLISLIAAQQLHHQHQPPLFPRSVSPYVARRKSHDTSFYRTPQVGPNHSYDFSPHHKTRPSPHHHRHHHNSKHQKQMAEGSLSFLFTLFRSRSDKLGHPDPPRLSSFSAFRRNNQSSSTHKPCRRVVDPGMSLAMAPESDDDPDDYSPKSTPVAVRGGKKGGHLRNSSASSSFCLSPLVRASPHRHWTNHKCSSDVVVADVRPRNLSVAASFCANRSRKLADFGREARSR